MRLSPAAEFAIRGVQVLAENYGRSPIPLGTICRQRSLSKEYLAKIFSALAKADLVEPIRGKNGGYVLTRSPSRITVLEVIEAVEGPIALNFCQHTPPKCERKDCKLRKVWSKLQKTICTTLRGVTLADCLS